MLVVSSPVLDVSLVMLVLPAVLQTSSCRQRQRMALFDTTDLDPDLAAA